VGSSGYDYYRRNAGVTSSLGTYNLCFLDEVEISSSSTYPKSYYSFKKAKNKKFIDYCVVSQFSLAIKDDGNLYTMGGGYWGDGISGTGGAQTNPNKQINSYTFRLVDDSGNWEKIFADSNATWVLNSNKELYRCGMGTNGVLGLGDTNKYWKLMKLDIAGVTRWKKVAQLNSGDYCSFVLSEDGRLFVSGTSQYGELGLVDPYDVSQIEFSFFPGMYPGTSHNGNKPIIEIASDGSLILSGNCECSNVYNQSTSTYINVTFDGTYVQQTHSSYSKFYVKDGDPKCAIYCSTGTTPYWYIGTFINNSVSALFNSSNMNTNTTNNNFQEIIVNGVDGWSDIVCASYSVAAISNDGRLFVWGRNNYGQLAQGQNNTSNIYKAKQIGVGKTWVSCALGAEQLIAVASDGTAWGSGRNNHYQLGLGNTTQKYELTQIGNKTTWKGAICYNSCSALIDEDSRVYYFGYYSGAYGGSGNTNETIPTYHGFKIGNYKRWEMD
jgi:alpha-tubulin suppressor-like RCC1 family protein